VVLADFKLWDPDGGTLILTAVSEEPGPDDAGMIQLPAENIRIVGTGPDGRISLTPGVPVTLQAEIVPVDGPVDGYTSRITVRADDGTEHDEVSFLLGVNYINKAPVIGEILSQTTDEDVPGEISFTISDAEGGALLIRVTSENENIVPNDPEHINIEDFGPDYVLPLPADGSQSVTLRLTPAYNMNGPTFVTVKVEDGDAFSGDSAVTERFLFTVRPKNDPPYIERIAARSTSESTMLENVPLNISDAEGGQLTIKVTSENEELIPSNSDHITIKNSADPGLGFGDEHIIDSADAGEELALFMTFTPLEGEIGSADIVVTVEDTAGAETANSQMTFRLNVDVVNKSPEMTIQPPGTREVTTDEESPKEIPVMVSDADYDDLLISVESSNTDLVPNDGDHILVNGDGLNPGFNQISMDVSPRQFPLVITPAENKTGNTTIMMSADDGVNPSVEISFVLKVGEINDPPEFPDFIATQIVTEDIESDPISFRISDPEGGRLTITATSSDETLIPIDDDHVNIAEFGAEYQTVTDPGATANLSLTLTPNMIFTDNDSETVVITLRAEDEKGDAGTRDFTVKVGKTNRPPEITGFYYDGPAQEDQALSDISFSLRDAEGGRMELSVRSSNTSLFPNDFNYVKIDGIGPDYVLDIVDTDTDIPLILWLRPFKNEFGPAIITLTVRDLDGGHEVTEDIMINVQPVADRPIISAIPRQATDRGEPKDVTFTVSDEEGGDIVISVTSSDTDLLPSGYPYIDLNDGYGNELITSLSGGGSMSLSLTLTPVAGKFGTTDITVSAEDSEGGRSSKVFSLDVDVVNMLPGLDMSGIESQITDEDTPVTVSFVITDAEGGGLPISVSSENTSLLPGDGASPDSHINIIDGDDVFGASYIADLTADTPKTFDLKLTPGANQTGSTKITVTVGDTGGEVSNEFILRVNPLNDPPIISDIGNQETLPNTPVEVAFSLRDMEGGMFEGDKAEVSVESTNDALVPNDVDHLSLIGPDGQTFGIVHKFVLLRNEPIDLKLKVTPTDASGELPIVISADDGSGELSATAEMTFSLKIGEDEGANTSPVISGISNWKMNEDDPSADIVFTVEDKEGSDGMIVSAASSDTVLLPNDAVHMNIQEFGTTYILRLNPLESKELRLKVRPVPDQNGQTVITVTVQDDDKTVAKNFYLLVDPENDLPQISGISDKTTPRDIPLNVAFTVGDMETPADSLIIKAESSDTSVVSNTGIVIAGSGDSRTLEITPVTGRIGETLISVTVGDGVDEVVENFKLTVTEDNTPPVISIITSPQITQENVRAEIYFTVSDAETAARNLVVTVSSRNQSVVPDANIDPAYLGDSAVPNYRLRVTPATNQTGDVLITISVDDGIDITESAFTLTVILGDANPPDISNIFTPRYTNEDQTKVINFNVTDDETAILNVYAYSENQAVIPDDNLRLKYLGSSANPNYELAMTPVPNENGDVRITIVADDGDAPSSAVFTLKIISINDGPEIYDMVISDTDTSVATQFKVRDAETLPEDMVIRVTSSNTRLLPSDNIMKVCGYALAGACGETEFCCQVTAFAEAGYSGSSLVSVEADDGAGVMNSVAEESFFLSVGYVLPGDLDGNGALELGDAILALRVMAGIRASVNIDADVNGDGQIGAAEAAYVLREIAK